MEPRREAKIVGKTETAERYRSAAGEKWLGLRVAAVRPGSPGWIRTNDQPINSRLLYR